MRSSYRLLCRFHFASMRPTPLPLHVTSRRPCKLVATRSACGVLNASSRMRAVVLRHERLLKACIHYVLSLPVAIERCCGINASRAENCRLTNSDLELRVAIAQFQNNSSRFQQAGYASFSRSRSSCGYLQREGFQIRESTRSVTFARKRPPRLTENHILAVVCAGYATILCIGASRRSVLKVSAVPHR